jgi:hypothetical protein
MGLTKKTKLKPGFVDLHSTEVAVINSQLANSEGRFVFYLFWYVYDPGSQQAVGIKGQKSRWSAGSVEEMLAAIQATEIALEHTPGIARSYLVEQNQAEWHGKVEHCASCGRVYAKGTTHDPEECAEGLAKLRSVYQPKASRTRSAKRTAANRLRARAYHATQPKSQKRWAVIKRAYRARLKAEAKARRSEARAFKPEAERPGSAAGRLST